MGFLSRKKKDPSPAANPYANAADPYQTPPPKYSSSNNINPQEKSASITGQGQPYGSSSGGYNAQGGSYSSQSGYGTDRYGGAAAAQRPGGYGGLGRLPSQETVTTDAGREQLFGNAPKRLQARSPPSQEQSSGSNTGVTNGAYGGHASGGYGSYDTRALTQEEQEEEDISATKNEIKFIKQQDVASTRNALRQAELAEQIGRDTLARLAAQGERIHNTERNLDLASTQNRIAEEKARELKTLNKSMFAVHVANPFTASSRRNERDAKIMDTHRQEREEREATRKAAWESQARKETFNRQLNQAGAGGKKGTLADRAKYQFEADSDDDQMEDEIEGNVDAIAGKMATIKGTALALGREVENQNKLLERVADKTDKVDDQIAMNSAKLARFK